MVEQARELLPGGRPTCAGPTCSSSTLGEPVDAVLSTATFHWVADHDRLFAQPARRAEAGRAARRPVRRGTATSPRSRQAGLGRRRASRRSPSTSPAGRPTGSSPRPRRPTRRLRAGRLQRRLVLAHARRRRPRAIRRPTCARSASARSSTGCRRSCASRSSPPRWSGSPTRSDPLRAPEHPRPRLSPGLLDSKASRAVSRAAVRHVAAPLPRPSRAPPRRRRLAEPGASAFVSQSLRPYLIAAVADRDARRPTVVVAGDDRAARDLAADLRAWLRPRAVRFYPSRGVAYESHLTPPAHLVGLRVAALDARARPQRRAPRRRSSSSPPSR